MGLKTGFWVKRGVLAAGWVGALACARGAWALNDPALPAGNSAASEQAPATEAPVPEAADRVGQASPSTGTAAAEPEADVPGGTQSLSGKVRVAGAPDAVPGAKIEWVGTTLTAVAGLDGSYRLGEGPAGPVTLKVTADGFRAFQRTYKALRKKTGQRRIDVGLAPEEIEGDEVVVTGHHQAPQAVQSTVTQAQIKEIPGSFGDALRAVQDMPGVGAPNDFSGQLLVQGAGPEDNLYLIDAIPWPVPYHFGGLVSTVSPDVLNKVDLYEAGYGAKWGGSLASVLDAQTAEPMSGRLHLDADANLLQATGSMQGSLGMGDATFLVAGRRSYFDLVARAMGISDFPVYWDGQLKVDFSEGAHDKFRVLVLGSDDSLGMTNNNTNNNNNNSSNAPSSIQYHNGFESGGVTWVDTRLKTVTSSFTPYVYHTDQIIGIDQLTNDTYKTVYGLKEEAEWAAGKWAGAEHEIGLGGDVEMADYTFEGYFPRVTSTAHLSFDDFTSLPDVASTVQSQGYSGYLFLLDRAAFGPWILTAGVHADSESYVADGRVGPRLSLEWHPDSLDKWTVAWGLYDQAPSPLNVNPQFGNPGLTPEDAEHLVLGYQRKLPWGMTASVDAYDKKLWNLVESNSANPDLYDNNGIGQVVGADLDVRADLGKKFFGWISYSYSHSTRLDEADQAWGLYQYDQPNILNLVGSYAPSERWTLGGKFRYTSGNLVLPGDATLYEESDRLPAYVRLDLRVDRSWKFQTWTLKVYGEILNVFNRVNPAETFTNNDGDTQTVDDLPRIPDLGIEATY